ncbi:hypothetical protein GUJ93_ZPchr0011g27651 [Zizania palustris]|uniref:Uncharacterized protein n=1 Tax=Zizania palustris TaxID=103762 RepID=A0A8J5WJ48_ZIZPA|nr:hypothetical protein GUJ93_ZPchr0011g27651 [Zizania palustris]
MLSGEIKGKSRPKTARGPVRVSNGRGLVAPPQNPTTPAPSATVPPLPLPGPSFFLSSLAQTLSAAAAEEEEDEEMIYDVNSPLFRSFLSQKGGASSDKRALGSPLSPHQAAAVTGAAVAAAMAGELPSPFRPGGRQAPAMARSGGPVAKSSAPAVGLPSAAAGLPSPFGLAAAAGQAPAMAGSGAAMARSSALAAAATRSGGPAASSGAPAVGLPSPFGLAAAAARPSLAAAAGHPSLAADTSLADLVGPSSLAAATSLDAAAARPSLATAAGSPSLAAATGHRGCPPPVPPVGRRGPFLPSR